MSLLVLLFYILSLATFSIGRETVREENPVFLVVYSSCAQMFFSKSEPTVNICDLIENYFL